MRDRLFRGKRKDNGEWVYGWLGHLHCHNPQAKTIESIYFTEITEDHNDKMNIIVDYKTVGQYTGRNIGEQKVFEGDILQNGTGVYIVCWDEKFLQWHVVNKKGNGCFNLNALLTDKKRPCKLIGNVHDNPELLKGDKNETA